MFDAKKFLADTSQWPDSEMGPYCCLNKKLPELGNHTEHAFILLRNNPEGTGGKIWVSLGNIFEGGTGDLVTFDSIDQILECGWQVD